ncbi:MAG: dioxygenase family protein [Planctomycetota bacterium]
MNVTAYSRDHHASSLLLLSVALACANGFASVAAESGEDDAPSSLRIAPEDEPGTPMRIVGIVREGGSGEPVVGAKLYVYHTDGKGWYSPGGEDDDNPRLAGHLKTDEEGRFEVLSVRPGSYYNTRATKHVHYRLSAPGHDEVVGEILFDDDPYLGDDMRANAARNKAFVITSPKTDDDGVAICEVVLRIGSTASARCPPARPV